MEINVSTTAVTTPAETAAAIFKFPSESCRSADGENRRSATPSEIAATSQTPSVVAIAAAPDPTVAVTPLAFKRLFLTAADVGKRW